ncbi:isoleucine--tRNA ligase [Segnochrobactrum spirostomi]|uniref:Isoleucine--tRNA ligase n=1 Tax=Segnochrobactrum spirostomi TaxID=2608987 RepID=A0A6A7Y2V9_9HYPH|nr:isoleucine--tRNA ligase [Segnochrobactrum spirostomi]MQT13045.1 isoleucine--tRNA ligase [Segnochrobactrum spirostomi]
MTSPETSEASARDYSETLFLPETPFPMRGGLPQREPELIARWRRLDLYRRLREQSKGREQFVLHDGPPYANGNLHIGHALNKILKDIVTRSHQMQGYDSNYVPGWDCHGLPIEWKIEEQYRAKGKNKDDVPIVEFRQECRQFAQHWVGVQSEEFQRLGVEGDFKTPYTTMAFKSEAVIAAELLKFATSGQLYRGSKPVMWSVVEKTALAEAEVEYHDYQSDAIFVKFPVTMNMGRSLFDKDAREDVENASVVIWTTTPWTIPGNRAISYSPKIDYALYEVTAAPSDNWVKVGERLILAEKLASEVMKAGRVDAFRRIRSIEPDVLFPVNCAHPLAALGYGFDVPLLAGDHVTDDAGTGFVHTAPGHGTDDFEVWMAHKGQLETRGIDTTIPYTVDADGYLTKDAPGFTGRRVLNDKGEKGDANEAVITALREAGALLARARLKHQYPHSWRSKKPIIFRNTPQWFIAMDKPLEGGAEDTLRARALAAIDATRFVPAAGRNRLRGMIENRPDWVVSRQRAWGVPIAVFVNRETGAVLRDDAVNARIVAAFAAEGADAWFAEGAAARFLGAEHDWTLYEKVDDILDVWFDSGSTHAFVLEGRDDLKWPADVYLEGSDQHRGWFHSSLLESCGTRGRAPYNAVVTHGFTMDEQGRKMSKSLGNQTFPQEVTKQYGADILRLWVASTDYTEDSRIGPEILKTNVDTYRKLRNTLRWLLGTLAHHDGTDVDVAEMPELERLMLHRLAELDAEVRQGYRDFDYRSVVSGLISFMVVDLSAFYFDVRKDVLYCDPWSSTRRKAALTVCSRLFETLVAWLAPLLPFTAEEAWLARHPSEDGSVHFGQFPEIPAGWLDAGLAEKWRKIRLVRRVVTGALEIERREKRIGSSLEAHPTIYVANADLLAALEGADLAEIAITSAATLVAGEGPDGAFRLDDVAGVAVVPGLAEGTKCARSWRILPEVGSDPDYPDLSLRDAAAMREYDARKTAA